MQVNVFFAPAMPAPQGHLPSVMGGAIAPAPRRAAQGEAKRKAPKPRPKRDEPRFAREMVRWNPIRFWHQQGFEQ